MQNPHSLKTDGDRSRVSSHTVATTDVLPQDNKGRAPTVTSWECPHSGDENARLQPQTWIQQRLCLEQPRQQRRRGALESWARGQHVAATCTRGAGAKCVTSRDLLCVPLNRQTEHSTNTLD